MKNIQSASSGLLYGVSRYFAAAAEQSAGSAAGAGNAAAASSAAASSGGSFDQSVAGKVTIKTGYAPEQDNVRLRRSDDGDDLLIELLDADGSVSESLKVEDYYVKDSAKIESVAFADSDKVWVASDFALAPITGGAEDDYLEGIWRAADVFDASAGGNDTLWGKTGNDTYWLGSGTDHDAINEIENNTRTGDSRDIDTIKVKSGYTTANIRLRRSGSGDDLVVELLDASGAVTDSLTVWYHYGYESGEVERVEFADGTVWNTRFDGGSDLKEIEGTAAGETLSGKEDFSDRFDSKAGGDDILQGKSGNDIYWLGAGTGKDIIQEYAGNDDDGDAGDMIRVRSGYTPDKANVRLRRSDDGEDLLVELLDADVAGLVSDSLTVEDYYVKSAARVESVEFADGTVWDLSVVAAAESLGGVGADELGGRENANDTLQGGSGDDVYWLGSGSGHDVIREYVGNSSAGDSGDKIKLRSGVSAGDVRLLRSRGEEDLIVQLLDASGAVTDSLTVEDYYVKDAAKVESLVFTDGTVWGASVLSLAEIIGTAQDDSDLEGKDNQTDVFDADAGGNDILQGKSGNDVYWLGAGTGKDTIQEYDGNAGGDVGDMIRVKDGYTPDKANVRLRRSDDGDDLLVELLSANANGVISDSLTVEDYYVKSAARVESVELADGTVWTASDFAVAAITGDGDNDTLEGENDLADVFDSSAGGVDTLQGKGGDDIYRLGAGTGKDIIQESVGNDDDGDAGDKIEIIGSDYGADDVRLRRSDDGDDLFVELLGSGGAVSDSLKVEDYYAKDAAQVERVEFADGTVWDLSVLAAKEILGGGGADELAGRQNVNDILQGKGGNDIYWLGAGSGHDVIREYVGNSSDGDAGDKIKIRSAHGQGDVRLLRVGDDLSVQLLDAGGEAGDSLTIEDYYAKDAAKVESVEFTDGSDATWNAATLTAAGEIKGTAVADTLGKQNSHDTLYGGGGDDVYTLDKDSGHDVIREHADNTGDNGDVIKIGSGYGADDVRLRRSRGGDDLLVQLLDAKGAVSDSLTVERYFTDASAQVESLEFADGAKWKLSDWVSDVLGDSGDDELAGRQDVNDSLQGGKGDDTYWLGAGSGHDVIREYVGNDSDGDDGDKIKIRSGIGANDVRLLRSRDGEDLLVQLLDAKGAVTDSLTVENHFTDAAAKVESVEFADGTVWGAEVLALTEITGGAGDETLFGLGAGDVFDSDGGGNDTLVGIGGNDVYWLGAGTGHDLIKEYYWRSSLPDDSVTGEAGDMIRIKDGYTPSDVRLVRSKSWLGDYINLVVQLLDDEGAVSDSLTVENHYSRSGAFFRSRNISVSARVESVEFADGTVWTAKDFARLEITGGAGDDSLEGSNGFDDVFDSDGGGNDILRGGGGNDVYMLGKGTGHDSIYDSSGEDDKIKIKSGYDLSDVRLARSKDQFGYTNLVVQLLDDDGAVTDSLTVQSLFTGYFHKIESIETDGHVLFQDQYQGLMDELAAFKSETEESSFSSEAAIRAHYWAEKVKGAAGKDTLEGSKQNSRHVLYGYGGDDVYLLGAGTGHDVIREHEDQSGHIRESGDAGDNIKIKSGYKPGDARLRRSREDLVVELLDDEGAVSDSLTVKRYYTETSARVESVEFADGTVWTEKDFALVEITGGADDDWLYGSDEFDDVFDSDAGGNDNLRGGGGNDVYLLGAGTGHDVIGESYDPISIYTIRSSSDAGDKIEVKSGYKPGDVSLSRSGSDLVVQLLGDDGAVSDSLTVASYYTEVSARVESVEFADGTVWTAKDFAPLEITGSAGNDRLDGSAIFDDIFDSDAGGNDTLRGGGGNDVYMLGKGTGHDVISEQDFGSFFTNLGWGSVDDKIKIKSGYKPADVRLSRSGNDLLVQLPGDDGAVTDSLTVRSHFTDDSYKIESIETDGHVLFEDQVQGLIDELAAFNDKAETSSFSSEEAIRAHYWAEKVKGAAGNDTLEGVKQNARHVLLGYGGDDVYLLGAGTGHDVIREHEDQSGNTRGSGDAGDKIEVKSGYKPADARLRRSGQGHRDLVVELLDADGAVSDSLTVERYYTDVSARVESVEFADGTVWTVKDFARMEITGGASDDHLYGSYDFNDVFDSDVGGNDTLHGSGGNDVYLLGAGTGHDVIIEHADSKGWRNSGDAGDKIKIKSGYKPADVRLLRPSSSWWNDDLIVQLLNADGKVTDSLTVERYYTDASARVESVEFADGTVWTAKDFALAEITGGADDDILSSSGGFDDVFDSDAGGNDTLSGYGGNDVYWLGAGTDHDVIQDGSGTSDKIKIKSGYAPADVRLSRSGNDLVVQLLGDDGAMMDSLTVEKYYTDASARIEIVEFADGTIWNATTLTAAGEIKGAAGADALPGKKNSNDTLLGYGGDDVYSLGKDSGHDVIREHTDNTGDDGDKIKIVGSGTSTGDVRLLRSGSNLLVQLLDAKGAVTDSLTVENHFTDDSAKVESLEFADGTIWNSAVLTAAGEIKGTAGTDTLPGKQNSNDTLLGYGGDDVYSLGKDSGHDVIREHADNTGDDGDKIKIAGSGYGTGNVRLSRSGNNLLVQLLDASDEVTDSLMVENHYTDASAKIESIEAAGHVLRENQFQGLIDEIAAFTAKTSSFASLEAIRSHYWEEDSTLTSSNG